MDVPYKMPDRLEEIEKFAAGIFEADRVQGLPLSLLRRYFLKGEGRYKVKPQVRELVIFAKVNLNDPLDQFVDTFDLIFCRNVIIYFDRDTQRQVVRKLARCLVEGGHLFLGHSETLSGTEAPLRFVNASIYQK